MNSLIFVYSLQIPSCFLLITVVIALLRCTVAPPKILFYPCNSKGSTVTPNDFVLVFLLLTLNNSLSSHFFFLMLDIFWLYRTAETHSESSQTFKMELVGKIIFDININTLFWQLNWKAVVAKGCFEKKGFLTISQNSRKVLAWKYFL